MLAASAVYNLMAAGRLKAQFRRLDRIHPRTAAL